MKIYSFYNRSKIKILGVLFLLFSIFVSVAFMVSNNVYADSNNDDFSVSSNFNFDKTMVDDGYPLVSLTLDISGSYHSFFNSGVSHSVCQPSELLSYLPGYIEPLPALAMDFLAEMKLDHTPKLLLMAAPSSSYFPDLNSYLSDTDYDTFCVGEYSFDDECIDWSSNKIYLKNTSVHISNLSYHYYFLLVDEIKVTEEIFWCDWLSFNVRLVRYRSNFTPYLCLRDSVRTMLSTQNTNLFDSNSLNFYRKLAGYDDSFSSIDVYINYKKLRGTYPNERVVSVTERLGSVSSAYAYNSSLMINYLVSERGLSLDNYHVICDEGYITSDDIFIKTNRVFYCEATSFSYVFNSTYNTGHITVNYLPYPSSLLYIYVNSNVPDSNLHLRIYPTSIIKPSPANLNRGKVIFDVNSIKSFLYNNAGWIFTNDTIEFSNNGYTGVTNPPPGGDVRAISNEIEVTRETSDGNGNSGDFYIVTYPESLSDNLVNLKLFATVEAVPDEEYITTVKYRRFFDDGAGISSEEVTTQETFYLTRLRSYSQHISNFFADNFDLYNTIYSACSFNELHEKMYATINGIGVSENSANHTAELTIIYSYSPLLKVFIQNGNDTIFDSYYYINNFSSDYSFSSINLDLPDYRYVSRIYSTENDVSIIYNGLDYTSGVLRFDRNFGAQTVIPLYFELSEGYSFEITYFEQYENTCFAKQVTTSDFYSLADYPELYTELTASQSNLQVSAQTLCKMLGQTSTGGSVSLGQNSIRIENSLVTRENNTFKVNCKYSTISLTIKDSNGDDSYTSYGLTSFKFWKDNYGTSEWTLQVLGNDLFPYSNITGYTTEESEGKIFGFFGLVAFQERLTNFNDWFSEVSSCGCRTFFNYKEVRGSDLYSFFAKDETHLAFAAAGGFVGLLIGHPISGAFVGAATSYFVQAACELFENDAGTYYTYLMYLDGTSDLPFFANNGADNIDDNQSAAENAAQHALEGLGGAIGGGSSLSNIASIGLGILAIGLLAFALIKFVSVLKPQTVKFKVDSVSADHKVKRKNMKS